MIKSTVYLNSISNIYRLGILFIILYCINFLGVGVYLPLLLIPLVFLYVVFFDFSRDFYKSLSILLSFSITYSIIEYFNNLNTFGSIVLYLIYPSSLLILGYILHNGEEARITRLLFIVVISFTLFPFLSLLKTMNTLGDMDQVISYFGGQRFLFSVWNSSVISATGINIMLSLSLSMLPLVIIVSKESSREIIKFKIITLVLFFISCYIVILMGNRTGLIMIIFSLLIVILFGTKSLLRKLLNIIYVFIVMIIGYLLFNNNFLGLKVFWINSVLYERFYSVNIIEDSRFITWWITLRGIFIHPLGGKEIDIPINYAHNLWLDVGYESGVLPFIILVLFAIISMITIKKFLNTCSSEFLRILIITIMSGFFLSFMVEPIIQGWFTFFNIFCFIIGMLHKHIFIYSKKYNIKLMN